MTSFDASTVTVAIALIGGTVLLAFASDALSQRFRVPDVLWLILFGLLAGPVLHIVTPSQVSELGAILGTVALIIILYDAGIDFNPNEARAAGTSGVLLAVGSYGLAAGALFVICLVAFSGGNLLIATIFALCLAGVSGAVVLPIARRLGFASGVRDALHLDMAIEDTFSVLAVTVLLTIVTTAHASWTQVSLDIVLPLPVAVGLGVVGGFVAIEFLSRWQSRVYAGLATMGILFVIYGATQTAGGSGIMAALIMGVVLGNDAFFRRWLRRSTGKAFAFDPSVRQVHNEVAFVLRAIFLVILGILVPFQPLGIVAAVAVIAIPFALLFARRWYLVQLEQKKLFETGYAQRVSALYGRGLTNAVLLIFAIAALPAVQSVLLPAFLVIIGTDIVMTVLIFLEPGPMLPLPPLGVGGASDPIPPFRPAVVVEPVSTRSDPPLPKAARAPGTAPSERQAPTQSDREPAAPPP